MLLFSSFLRAQSNPYIWSGKWNIRLSDLWDVACMLFMLIGDDRALWCEAFDGYRDVRWGDVGWDWELYRLREVDSG